MISLSIAVDCGPLNNIPNGQVSISPNTLLGSIATYSCDKYYKLVGKDSIRKCLPTGVWSGLQPQCIIDYYQPRPGQLLLVNLSI